MPVLTQEHHARLIADLPNICSIAGVQPKYMHQSMMDYCTKAEVDWVRHFHQNREAGNSGMLLEGVERPDVRCQAIAAALVRNFIDAQVIPLNTLLELHRTGNTPMPTVLLIPNLFVQSYGKTLPAHQVQAVYDMLLTRSVNSKMSVVYVENLKALGAAYGTPFMDFLSSFHLVK